MIDRLIEEKLLYKRGKKILVNQTNTVDFLKDSTVSLESKKNFLDYIKVLEDYNAINALVKNFDQYDEKLSKTIINLIDGLPFSKIEDNLERLITHRDINVRINTLKALGNLLNPELLKIVEPLISHSNAEIRMLALKTYYRIVFNNTVNEYSTLISSEDEHIKKNAYKNLLEFTSIHKEMEELKNITYFDSDLEGIEISTTKTTSNDDKSKDIDIKELYERLSRMEKNSGYSFATLLSISLILLLIVFINFHVLKTNPKDTEIAIKTKPHSKIVVSTDSMVNLNTLENATLALEKGDLDTAEKYFMKVSDKDTKTYNLFNIYMKKKAYEQAAYYFLELSRYSADNIKEYTELLNNIVISGNNTLAIQIAEKLNYFNSKEINTILLVLYKKLDIEKALLFARINNIIDLDILEKAADHYSKIEPQESIRLYEEILTFDLNEEYKEDTINKLLDISLELENNEKKDLLKSLNEKYPENNNIMHSLLDYHKEQQNITDALEIVDKLIKLEPDNKELLKDKIDLLKIISP
ncbi:MAG: hypothetical protein C0601_13500 [Candidatus Muiribacterium halophilum]|uniref:HEAT repeat domain-containing protein n=1 Tax=Muiribacterium halophilum TaxID=2053465 RepID=A0A2N5Z9E8_MUIH1|nr:MAG: hypothetical protein C0601_13500 [Candidatus Muirbacterium halophilum]